MLNFITRFKLEQAKETPSSGGAPKTFPIAPTATPPVAAAPVAAASDDNLDELGYEKLTPDEKKPEEKAPEKKAAADIKVDTPATGYSEDPPKVEDPTPEPPAKKEEIDLGFELKLDGLPEEEANKIKEFAKRNKLSKEVTQELANIRQVEFKAAEKEAKEAEAAAEKLKQETRAQWHKELKEDPTFGGDKFAFNIKRAEKVVDEFMPGTKKMLTERKSMLPPYVMRDLANLADRLYDTEKLTQGDAPAPTPKDDNDPNAFLGDMYQ